MKYTLLKNRITGERSVRIAGGVVIREDINPAEYARLRKLALANYNRAGRNEAYLSVGLVRCRVNGRTVWE